MGKKKSQSQTTNSSSTNSSWLYDNKDMQNILNSVISNSGNMPDYVYEGLNGTQQSALNQLIAGRDQSGLQSNTDWMNQQGQNMTGQGQSNMQGASDAYSKYANMSQDDYLGMISNATNSDLVNQQKDIASRDINEQLNKSVNALNQQSNASGNMGSSRAGVAQGVMAGKAAQVLSDTNTAINQNAYQNAMNSVNNQISSSLSGASGLGSLGQSQWSGGMGATNSASNWMNTINQNKVSDLNNMWTAGGAMQQNAQNQANNSWYNQINQDNPYLGQLQLLLGTLGGTAGWSTSGTGTNTTTQSGGGGGWGSAIGGLAGAGIGGYFGGAQGAGVGSGVGGSVGGMFG